MHNSRAPLLINTNTSQVASPLADNSDRRAEFKDGAEHGLERLFKNYGHEGRL